MASTVEYGSPPEARRWAFIATYPSMMHVDCMTCLIQLANGLTPGGVHTDGRGVTHSTLRWLHEIVTICTLAHDDIGRTREWFVTDETVRV